MPQIIEIPNVGEVEFPDTMSEADISAAAQKLYQQSAPIQAPTEVALPTVSELDIPAMEAARREQMPSPAEQLQDLRQQSERFKQAFVAGQASLPLGILQAQEQFQQRIPAVQALKEMGIEVPSLRQELAATLPTPLAETVTFEPKGLAETGVMIGGGLLAFEEPALQAAAKLGKAASKVQEKVTAYDDAAGALFKRGQLGEAQARYELPAVNALTLNADEVKKAKGLEKTLSRQENLIARIDQQQLALEALPNKTLEQSLEVAKLKGQSNKAYQKYYTTIRDNQQILESEPYKLIKKTQAEFNGKVITVNNKEVPAFSQAISSKGVYVPPAEMDVLMNPTQPLSKPGIGGALNRISAGPLSTTDHLRLIQEADGNRLQGPLYKLLVEPAEIATRDRQVWANKVKEEFRLKAQELGLNNMSKERNKFIFRVADGKIPRETANLTPQENEFINFFTKNYSDWIDMANAKRAERGMDLIKKRQNYITHITEMSLFDELGFGIDAATADVKLSKLKKAEKARFQFEKARTGEQAIEDVFGAVERYADSISKQIYYTDTAAVLQARTDVITDPALKVAQQRFLNEAFLGQLDFKDEVLVQLGMRGPLNLAAKLSSNFTTAAILGNINVLASQFSQIPATVKEAGTWPALVGLYRAARPLPKEVANASSFLTLRQISDEVIPLKSTVLNKAQDFVLKGLEFTDKYVARASWEAGFVNAKRRGFSNEAAIKHADDIARMLHANYGNIYKPALLRGQTGKAALPLQSFFLNFWNYLSKDQKALAELKNTTRLRETMKAIGAMAAANQVYRAVGLPDVFAVNVPESTEPEEILRATRANIVGNVPVAKILLEGVQPPASRIVTSEAGMKKDSVMRNAYTLAFSDDPDKKEEALKSLRKSGFKFVPGGIQINKTLDGMEASRDGYVNIGREIIPLTAEDRRLAPIVGKYQVPSVVKARKEMDRRRMKRFLEGK
jgi:hypothetical protein